MFYFDLRHNVKKDSSSKNTFHYITRTAHFKNDKKHDGENLEWVKSGNMPKWADGRPDQFWAAADKHEIARGRTSSAITIALPNGLTVSQRQALAQDLIQEFATQHQLPYTAAIHTHKSSITGEEQPHLHLMYSERSLSDGLERLPEQFFSQYRPKSPTKGGAPKLTANALGYGKNQIQAYRKITETLINKHLQEHAPTKKLLIGGIEVEVPSLVSCLSNKEYSKKHGIQLEDVPQISRWKLHADDLPPDAVEAIEKQKDEIRAIRERNRLSLYRKEYEAALKQQQEQQARKAELLKQQEQARKAELLKHDLQAAAARAADFQRTFDPSSFKKRVVDQYISDFELLEKHDLQPRRPAAVEQPKQTFWQKMLGQQPEPVEQPKFFDISFVRECADFAAKQRAEREKMAKQRAENDKKQRLEAFLLQSPSEVDHLEKNAISRAFAKKPADGDGELADFIKIYRQQQQEQQAQKHEAQKQHERFLQQQEQQAQKQREQQLERKQQAEQQAAQAVQAQKQQRAAAEQQAAQAVQAQKHEVQQPRSSEPKNGF